MLTAGENLQRVIKNRSTRNYYVSTGRWTSNARDAKIFKDLSLAFEAAHNDGLKNRTVVVFRTGSREVDAQFPIDSTGAIPGSKSKPTRLNSRAGIIPDLTRNSLPVARY
jgi:hypothetical protein